MRLIYKLLLISVLPLLITVALILFVNKTLTETTLQNGVERAALEQFDSKSSIIRAFFDSNLQLLQVLGKQDDFRYGTLGERLAMMRDWEAIFPGIVHRIYFYDGQNILSSSGDAVKWNPGELGLDSLEENLVGGQIKEPGSEIPLLMFWHRLQEGVLGVSRPVTELAQKIDMLNVDDVALTVITDGKEGVLYSGPYAAKFREENNPGHTLQRLMGIMAETTLDTYTFELGGVERLAVSGVLAATPWRLAFLLEEGELAEASKTVNSLGLLILALAMVPILLMAYLLNLALIRPLASLMWVQQEIGKGNLEVKALDLPKDEIGELGQSLNMMAQNLRSLSGDLAFSEQRFKLLAENIPGVIYLCNNDPEYSVIYLNDAMEILSGYQKADFGDGTISIARLILPEDLGDVYAEVDACLARREPFHLFYRIRHRSGGIKWVEEYGTGVWEGERLLFLEGFISDITERKESEELLKSSETRYRALIEGAMHPITILSPDARILLVNSVGARNLGMRAEDCAGKSLADILPMLYESTLARINEVLHERDLVSFEDKIELPDGVRWFWSFLQQICLDEEENAVLVMSYDITDRKRAEEALRYRLEFENLLSDMSANFINIDHKSIDQAIEDALAVLTQFVSCDGAYVFLFDTEKKSAQLSHSWHNGKFGALLALLKGTPIQLMPGWVNNILNNKLNIADEIEGVAAVSADEKFTSEDVGVRSLCEVPLASQDNVLGVLGLCNRDMGHAWTEDEGQLLKFAGHVITNALQRKSAETSLARYRNELESLVLARTQELEETQAALVQRERLATLGQLTATVSHELRNPLGTIRGSFYTIAERSAGRGLNIERALERIERNIIRCDTIIEELLDFTRSRSLELKVGDPDALVFDLVEDYHLSPNLHLDVDLGVGCQLLYDQEKFRRCVINLLNNSCEAMREMQNSRVCRPGSKITITSKVSETHYILSVSDNGPGISQKAKEKVFEPLFSTKGFGVGLGLTLVQQIMEQHGGGISINSKPGDGTQVLLTLPLKSTPPKTTT